MATICMSQDDELAGVIVCAIHPGKLKTASAAADADTEPANAAGRLKFKIDGLGRADNPGLCPGESIMFMGLAANV